MSSNLNRRDFIATSGAGAAAITHSVWTGVAAAESKSASDKLSIACIGTANRASADIGGVKGENIVALCDIDENYLKRAKAQFPNASFDFFNILLYFIHPKF